MKKVFIPQDITDSGKNFLRERGYELVIGTGIDMDTMFREGGDADAILARTESYHNELIGKMPNLKVIGRHGIGLDNIDVAFCTERKIIVTYTPLANANSVAEHAITMILACAKNLVIQDKQTRSNNFASRNKLKGQEVTGKTLGIVGCGRIGMILARIAALGLNMKVIGFDTFVPSEKFPEYFTKVDSVEAVFKQSDFVSLNVPATPETRKMVNKSLISIMKPTAYLINCARGEIMDEADLYNSLKNSVIAGAAIDVFDQEPPKADNPLFGLDNIIVSPHNAALTKEAMDRMGLHAAMGIDAVLSGNTPEWPANKIS